MTHSSMKMIKATCHSTSKMSNKLFSKYCHFIPHVTFALFDAIKLAFKTYQERPSIISSSSLFSFFSSFDQSFLQCPWKYMEEKVTTKHVQNMHKRSISLQLPPLSEYNSNKMCSPEFPLGIIPEIISLRFYCIPLRHFTLKHHLGLAQKRGLVQARRKKFSLKPQSLSSVIFLPIFNLHFFTFSSTPCSRTMSIFLLKSYLPFFEFQV